MCSMAVLHLYFYCCLLLITYTPHASASSVRCIPPRLSSNFVGALTAKAGPNTGAAFKVSSVIVAVNEFGCQRSSKPPISIQCKSNWLSGLPVSTAPNVTKCHRMSPGVLSLLTLCLQAILYSFPAICWLYGAGLLFSSFASLVFWGQPAAKLWERLRTRFTRVVPVGLQVCLSSGFLTPRSDIPARLYIPRCLL